MSNLAKKTIESRNYEIIILVGIILLTILLRMAFIFEPFERDEGMYAYIGQEILRGAIPYRDVIDHKPPGIHYLYALIIAISGPTTVGIRIVTSLYASFTTAAVYLVSRRNAGIVAGQIAALLYALFSGLPILQGSSSNSEVFMALPVTISVYFYIKFIDSNNRIYLSASGINIATAVLIKTVAIPIVAIIVLSILYKSIKYQINECCIDLLAFIIPQLAIVLAVLSFFFYHNALSDIYHWNITFNVRYGAVSFERRLQYLINSFDVIAEHGVLWLVAIPASIWLIFIKRTRTSVFLGSLVPASFVGVSMPGFYFQHYFIQMISPLAIVSGVALASIYNSCRSAFRIITSILIVIACYLWYIYDYRYYINYSPNKVSLEKYGTTFVDSESVAEYLKLYISPGDYIYHWGFDPELYFLTGSRAPNRFTIYCFVENNNYTEIYESLLYRKPTYIIINTSNALPGFTGYDTVKNVVNEHYYLEKTIGNYALYHIKK